MTRMRTTKTLDLPLLAMLLAIGCVEEGEAVPDDDDAPNSDVGVDVAAEHEELENELEGLVATPPPPGTSVWSETLYADGTTRQFMLHTTADGEVVFEELVDDRISAGPPEELLALDPCSDDAYIHTGWRWDTKLRWYFHAGSTPSELDVDAAEAAIEAATSNITGSHNSCGLADEVGASHEYLGRKSKAANINSSGDCLTSDGVNVVSFGDLPTGTLATACVWFSGGVAKEGDVQLNKADHDWTTSPGSVSCSKQFSVKAVMTHERGHTFGLGHVGESSHGDLTMSPTINGPCQDSESTLGEGDVAGLRALY